MADTAGPQEREDSQEDRRCVCVCVCVCMCTWCDYKLKGGQRLKLALSLLSPPSIAEREKEQVADPTSYTVGAFSSSRFIIAAMAMLTAEYEAVDLSLLLNEGVIGLSQTALRLAGQAFTHEALFLPQGVLILQCICSCIASLSLPPPSIASIYRSEEEEDEDGCLVGVASYAHQSHMSGAEALSRMEVGTRVVRGQDWKWGDQVCVFLCSAGEEFIQK